MSYTINIIGAGNVAWHLCNALSITGHKVQQVYSRTFANSQKLANTFGIEAIDVLYDLKKADIILLAVNDDQIDEVSNQLNIEEGTVVLHTSGTVSIEILNKHKNYGVLWMIETLTAEKTIPYDGIAIITYYNNDISKETVYELAKDISTNVHVLADSERQKMHLAAVMANNFTNHLYTRLEEWTSNNKLNFDLLKPIIKTTVNQILQHSPATLQTGPAVRNDIETMHKHKEMLASFPDTKALYELMSASIKGYHS